MGEHVHASEPDAASIGPPWLRTAVVFVIVAIAVASNAQLRSGGARLAAAVGAQLRSPATHAVNLRSPRSGELALTEPIFHTIELLRTHAVERFRLSPALSAEPFVQQRLIEGAWPIRFDETADFELGYLFEPSECEVVARREFDPGWRIPRRQAPLFAGKRGVRLARCR